RIARARVEADCLQVLDQPFGGPAAILGECGVGRDRWNPYQGEQAFEAGVEIGIDALEDFFNSGHWAAFRFCGREPIAVPSARKAPAAWASEKRARQEPDKKVPPWWRGN